MIPQSVEMCYEDENIWITQKMLAVLYNVDVRTVNYRIKKIFEDSELQEEATIRKFRIVQKEGECQVSRELEHNSLQMIIPMIMQDWAKRLDTLLQFSEYEILNNAGKVTDLAAKGIPEGYVIFFVSSRHTECCCLLESV